jgi:hypothetical protein
LFTPSVQAREQPVGKPPSFRHQGIADLSRKAASPFS